MLIRGERLEVAEGSRTGRDTRIKNDGGPQVRSGASRDLSFTFFVSEALS